MDWKELEELVRDQQEQGNPVAERILRLNLAANQITLELDDPADWDDSDSSSSDQDEEMGDGAEAHDFSGPLAVDVDIFESAFANAQRYYNSRRQAGVKHAKTLAISSQALQSAEQKIKTDLKATKVTVTVSQLRKPFWFEKFSWFISSDGYLVLAGRDMQQNELLVKRHLRAGDAYVHADIHGAASVIVKNKPASAAEMSAENIPPSTLFQAGIMSVCQSRAWDAKIVTSAWWVEASQVSKTAPTGEYLSTGSFMIRGKKHFLPPTQLVYGFGFLFRLADDESVARHVRARQQRQAIMEENLRAATGADPADVSRIEDVEERLSGEHAAIAPADDDSVTVVGGKARPPAKTRTEGGAMDFSAARKKYNLDEIEIATVDDFGDEDKTLATAAAAAAARGEGKRQISAKERRDMRKQRTQGSDNKGKMKKMKGKYAEQDDEDRELRMALLGASGKKDIDVLMTASRTAATAAIVAAGEDAEA
ncbi:hypothetical protein GGI00_005571, partial [Coemansia sp. RSA 2681]